MMRGLVVLLLIILIASGLMVIYAKYNSRLIFIEIQKARHELGSLEVEWERLMLEESMLSEHNRVEQIGRSDMGLINVKRKDIRYIKL